MTEIQASAAELLLKRKHDVFSKHMVAAVEALVVALEEEERDRARAAEALREREAYIQEQQALLDRCAEALDHALRNVKALTGGDERRMRQLLSALRKEDNVRDMLLDENAELRRRVAHLEEALDAARRLGGAP